MKLTKASDPKEIARLAHLKSAGVFHPRCGARFPGDVYTCTLKPEHHGLHGAHTLFGTVVAVWDDCPPTPSQLDHQVHRFIQFGYLTDNDLYQFSEWCGSVVLGLEGDVNSSAAQQFFMPLSSMAVNLLQVRAAKSGRTATYSLDRSLVSGIDASFLGFIEALLRGQLDSFASEGRSAAAELLSTVIEFVQAELGARNT